MDPLDNGLLLDLDAPTLPAESYISADGRVPWRVWCVHCGEWHYHGPGDGHRIAHCAPLSAALAQVKRPVPVPSSVIA